uniref:Uncharacterized protein n=1 Tax=Glossina morsitans morsitans TaxID=37546 RepID=A0A1B0G2C3_GLOMM
MPVLYTTVLPLQNNKNCKNKFNRLIAQRPGSASLLPPAVNSGLFWSFAAIYKIYENDESRFSNVVFNNPSQWIVSGEKQSSVTL